MIKKMLRHCALAATFVAAFGAGGFAVGTSAMAQPYYAYAPGYGPGLGPGLGPGVPWGAIIANSNHSVPFDPGDAALSYRYGRSYGYCGYTIAGC